MINIKPKKRAAIYWYIEYGFFFLSASLLLVSSFLRASTSYFYLTFFFFYMSLAIFYIGAGFVAYKWSSTEYFFAKKYLFIKEGKKSYQIPYSEIKDINCYGNLLQSILGSSNVYLKTNNNMSYKIRGINPDIVCAEITKKSNQ